MGTTAGRVVDHHGISLPEVREPLQHFLHHQGHGTQMDWNVLRLGQEVPLSVEEGA